MASDISLAGTTSEYISGSIKWTGLGSGTDFGSVVDQLMEIEKIQYYRLEDWKSTWEEKKTSIEGLNSRMESLFSFTQGFDEEHEFYSRSSTSSDSSILTVSNASTAQPGSHNIVVGSNIPGMVASCSFKEGDPIGGTSPLTITVGSAAPIVVAYNPATDDIDAIAALIDAADTGNLLRDAQVVEDKVRGTDTYKRLIITAENGGTDNAITVTDDSGLNLSQNTVDEVYEKTWLGGSGATVGATATYAGSSNKTFTFAVATTGIVGVDDIKIQWADDENNSGSFVIEADSWTPATEYDVFQGVTLSFSSGTIIKNDSFTVDVYTPVLQAAQDEGLAQTEQVVHEGFVDLITSVTTTAAEFVYRYEGVETTVDIAADTKLEGLAKAINNDPNNRGVQATIINDGQGTSKSYHLVLTGRHTGVEHSIEIVSDTMTDFDTAGTFETSREATNAMVKVDGYPSDDSEYIQRSSNTVADVISGVILELQGAGAATVTVTTDTATIQANIEQLVESVNFVLDYVRQETEYDPDTGESGIMIGNYTYDMVRSIINEIMYRSIPGLDPDTDDYTHLSQIGIKTNPDLDGRWMIDSSVLEDALNNNLEAVSRLFIGDVEYDPDGDGEGSSGVSDQLRAKMDDLTDSEAGIANVLLANYDNIIKDIDDKLAREERRLVMVQERLETRFANLEALLTELEGQGDYLDSQLDQLPTIGD